MTSLFWHTTGTRETAMPVLFLHGFMGRGRDWDRIAGALPPGYSALYPDLPGHGETFVPPGATGYAIEQCAALLLEDLDELGVPQCAVVGYSMGGRVALYLALHHPGRVSRLVLESASPGLPDESVRARRRQHDKTLAYAFEAAARDGAQAWRTCLEQWYRQPLFESLHAHPQVLQELIENRVKNDPAALAQSLRGMGAGTQPSLWDALDTLASPTLLLTGALDRKYRQIAEDMCERNPIIVRHEMDGCGHNVHLENPTGYLSVLKGFLCA